MKRVAVVVGVLSLSAIGIMGCATEQNATKASDSLSMITNSQVIALSRAGISDSVIVAMMKANGTNFQLSPPDIIALADSGVTQDVLAAMIARGEKQKPAVSSEQATIYPPYYWNYDPFWWPWYGPYYGVRFGFGFPYYRHYGFYHHGLRGRRG